MKKIVFVLVFVVFLIQKGMAQSINLQDKLPIDTTIKKGVLTNGLTYYIKSTAIVKNSASYYIIQNVGSVLENDDQQGLAHFLEHMAFNGTKNFPGKGILNKLQKHGAVFGKDINAYTDFDETVYNMNNIPTKEGLVDTCLTILKDWSHYLLLTDEEIDSERGVIKEEWRTRLNGQMRLLETSLPVTYNYSKYAYRDPLGLMPIVENFEYQTLRDFYHDWYRTDLQAIAIIGDVDVNEIEQKIIKMFSEIPQVNNPKERIVVDIPDNTELMYSLGLDPEVSISSISYGIRHSLSLKDETVADLKQSILRSMATGLINARFSEQIQKPDATFLNAGVGFNEISRTSSAFNLRVIPKANQQSEAFYQALLEIIRAVKYGFTQSEIDRKIVQIKTLYKNKIARKKSDSHRNIIRSIQNNYLKNKTISDIGKEYEIVKQILDNLTKEELHESIRELYAKNNRFVNVTGVSNQQNLTKEGAKQIIKDVENNSNIKPYIEALEGKTLMSGIDVKKGHITKTIKNKEINSTTFYLSNGIKVHYKFGGKEKVDFKAISYGGTSLLKDGNLASASVMVNFVRMSGLGEFNATDLRKILAGKTANVRLGINSTTENISGSSNTKDVETMLQLVHLYFVKPRFDKQAFKVLKNNLDNTLARRSNRVSEIMRDSLVLAIYGKNNPKHRIMNQAFIDDISLEKIKIVYKDRFADASDFDFFITGSVNEEKLKPLLEKYIASLPTRNINEKYKDNGSEWVSDKIDKVIYLAMENPKSSVNIQYKKEIPYSKNKAIYTKALGSILQLRVTEMIRESEGGAYSPSARASFLREPKSHAMIAFSFDCNPNMVDKLVDIVNVQLQKIANGDIKEEDLTKIRTNLLKEGAQSRGNSSDMGILLSYFRFNENIKDSKNFKNIVQKMSAKDIQEMTNEILKEGQSYKVVFKPLK